MNQEFLLFGLSVALSFGAWGYISFNYALPCLNRRSFSSAARAILIVNTFRFVGASFLFPGVAGLTLPSSFSVPGGFGDLLAVVLAWVSLFLLNRPAGIVALWVFNVWGTVDLVFAFYQGIFGANFRPSALGATFYIPTVYVPMLFCAHAMLFIFLLRPKTVVNKYSAMANTWCHGQHHSVISVMSERSGFQTHIEGRTDRPSKL